MPEKVLKELNLSSDQEAKIKTINQTYKGKFKEAKEKQADKAALKKELRVLRKQRDKEVKSVLNKRSKQAACASQEEKPQGTQSKAQVRSNYIGLMG